MSNESSSPHGTLPKGFKKSDENILLQAQQKIAQLEQELKMRNDEILNAQKIAIYNDLRSGAREYDRLIFAIPAGIVAIVVGIIIGAFHYVENGPIRLMLIGIAMLFTFSTIIAHVKHRYFSNIVTENAIRLEGEFNYPIQRMTNPSSVNNIIKDIAKTGLFVKKEPRYLQKYSAHNWVRYPLWIVLILLALALIWESLIYLGVK